MNLQNKQIEEIRELYNGGKISVSDIYKKFNKTIVNLALKGHRRKHSEANTIAHKLHPENFKHSEATKQKMSKTRIKYLKENPDKVPYKINHSSKKSWPEEIFERALNRQNIINWVRNYMNGVYEYDFAFPLQKIDVEIDGTTHNLLKVQKIDFRRDEWSKQQGWKVIRFKAKHVLRNVEQCIELLQKYLNDTTINVSSEINESFLMLRTSRERQKIVRQQKNIQKTIDNDNRKKILQQQKIIEKQNAPKRISSNKLSIEIVFKRINDIKAIDKQWGYISELSKLWQVSHTRVRKFLKQYCVYEQLRHKQSEENIIQQQRQRDENKNRNEQRKTILLNYLQNHNFSIEKSFRQIEKELNIGVRRTFLKRIFDIYQIDKNTVIQQIESRNWNGSVKNEKLYYEQ
jgi:very-short-patch-repair endonuclease